MSDKFPTNIKDLTSYIDGGLQIGWLNESDINWLNNCITRYFDQLTAENARLRKDFEIAKATALELTTCDDSLGLAETVARLEQELTQARKDGALVDYLETLCFKNREGQNQLSFDFTMPTLREAYATIAAQEGGKK